MEAVKFAFDTLLVGALALPWLSLLVQMHFPPANHGADRYSALVSALPKQTREIAVSVVVLSLGYFLGAAVWRISDDFFRDPDVLWHMPTEVSIREDVYVHEYCDVKLPNIGAATPVPAQLKSGPIDFCPSEAQKNHPPTTSGTTCGENRSLYCFESRKTNCCCKGTRRRLDFVSYTTRT